MFFRLNFNGKKTRRILFFAKERNVERLLEFAQSENKPVKTVEYLKSALKRLETTKEMPASANLDGVTVKSV